MTAVELGSAKEVLILMGVELPPQISATEFLDQIARNPEMSVYLQIKHDFPPSHPDGVLTYMVLNGRTRYFFNLEQFKKDVMDLAFEALALRLFLPSSSFESEALALVFYFAKNLKKLTDPEIQVVRKIIRLQKSNSDKSSPVEIKSLRKEYPGKNKELKALLKQLQNRGIIEKLPNKKILIVH